MSCDFVIDKVGFGKRYDEEWEETDIRRTDDVGVSPGNGICKSLPSGGSYTASDSLRVDVCEMGMDWLSGVSRSLQELQGVGGMVKDVEDSR